MPKSKKTALYFYCQEQMRKQHRSMSMKEAIDEFYLGFKSLSTDEKAVYERMCAEHRDQEKYRAEPEIKVKIDPLLTHPEYNVDRAEVGMKELKAMFNLNVKVKSAARDQSAIDEQIRNNKWYFIKFITFCRTDSSGFKEGMNYAPYFVLGEVALVEYSLKEGITKVYQEFVQPNPIPLGYRAACMDSSANSHKIPLSNEKFDRFRKAYDSIYADILEFIGQNSAVPLFCFEADNEATRFALDYLHDQAVKRERNVFPVAKIYDLECLLMFLAENKEIELVYSSANEILTSSMYDYSPNSLCEFHEDQVLKECALGYMKRSAYAISDNLCLSHYGVDLTPNHIPVCKPVGTIVDHSDFKSVISRKSVSRTSESSFSSESARNGARASGFVNDKSRSAIYARDMNMPQASSNYLNHPNDPRYRSQESVVAKAESKYNYPAVDVRIQQQQQPPVQQPAQPPRAYGPTRRLVSDKLESLSNRSQVDSESARNTSRMSVVEESETLTTISGYDNATETASVFSQSRMTDDVFSVKSVQVPSVLESDTFDDQSSMISDDRFQAPAPVTATTTRKLFTPANEELESKLPGNDDEGWQEVRVTGKDARQNDQDEFMGDENSSVASSGALTWGTRTSASSGRPVGLGRGKTFKLNK